MPISYGGSDIVEWSNGTITVSRKLLPTDRFPPEILPCALLQVDDLVEDLQDLGYTEVKRVILLDPLWN